MNFYEILGVDKSATTEEIKRAYRREAQKFHPDRNHSNPEASERFKEVNEAYQVLINSEKRAIYDNGFQPIESVRDLLIGVPAGQNVVSLLTPRAPKAQTRGVDVFTTVTVPSSLWIDGGSLDIESKVGEKIERICVQLPPLETRGESRMLRIRGAGEAGANGGEVGDLFLVLVR